MFFVFGDNGEVFHQSPKILSDLSLLLEVQPLKLLLTPGQKLTELRLIYN